MSTKKNKKNENLSDEENILIRYLNDYLEKNGTTFRAKSIILVEKEAPASSGSTHTESKTEHNDTEAFKVFTGTELNLELMMSVCNLATKPHCKNGEAFCVANSNSAPFWKCPD